MPLGMALSYKPSKIRFWEN